MSGLEGNLWRYRAYNAVVFTPFALPVLVVFWQDNGLDLVDVFVLQALFAVGVVLLEVPTGLVADRMGKRTSLILASAVGVLANAMYAAGTGFWTFLAAELGLALAASFYSGADAALLYDTLDRLDRREEYARREGEAKAWQLAGFATCCLLGGAIGAWSPRAAMWANVTGAALSLAVAWGMVEASGHAATTLRDAATGYRALIADSARFVSRHRLVSWHIAWLGALTGSATWLLWLYQPYLEHSGVPLWTYGFVFAAFNLFAAWSSRRAHAVAAFAGPRGVLWLLAALQVAPLLLMAAFVTPWSWLFVFGHQAVRAIARPVASGEILRHTWADKRSTVLSIAGLTGRLFFAATALPIGLAAEHLALPAALLVQAAALVVVLGALLALRGRVPAKYETAKLAAPA